MNARAEHGYATVWVIGWMAILLTISWLVLLMAVAVARQHRLDGAADLGAISGAAAARDGDDACQIADRIVAANHVSLSSCELRGADVTVRVGDTLDLPIGVTLRLTSAARAGPG